MGRLTLTKLPWNAHGHLRDDAILRRVAPIEAGNFWGGIVMPNLLPPVVTGADADQYRTRIMAALGDNSFEPVMTLYLTDNTDPDDVAAAYESGIVIAMKKYPLHGTTNSAAAVTDLANVVSVLEMMEQIGMPLLIHGEQPTRDGTEPLNPLKREPRYLTGELNEIRERFPDLRISLEHISTKEAAALIQQYGNEDFVATVTPQHLVTHIGWTMYKTDGAYMPCAKDEEDMLALRELIASGCEWIHLGTDFAPHTEAAKSAVSCACGAFTPHAHELYLEAFAAANCLNLYQAFACERGPRFFGLEPKTGTMSFERAKWQHSDFYYIETRGGARHNNLMRPFGFRTVAEGGNRTMTWQRAE